MNARVSFVLCETHLRSLSNDSKLVTDYGDENPLLFDYYGFPEYLYKLKFKSRGDSNLANTVVELYNKVRRKPFRLWPAPLINMIIPFQRQVSRRESPSQVSHADQTDEDLKDRDLITASSFHSV
jgi:hypothetical protein